MGGREAGWVCRLEGDMSEMRKGEWRESERERGKCPTVPAMSLEICVLLLNHFPLKKIKKAEIFSN